MKRGQLLFLPVAAFAAIALAGCGPKLAQTELGQKEMEWEQYLKDTYPEWRPPQTLPPVVTDAAKAQKEAPEAVVAVEEEVVVAVDEPSKITENPANYEMYTVQKGDSLWKISKKFYKSGSKWQRIKEANADQLPKSGLVKPGMELRIPLP
jgi:nucleoid-associated protein YgaU